MSAGSSGPRVLWRLWAASPIHQSARSCRLMPVLTNKVLWCLPLTSKKNQIKTGHVFRAVLTSLIFLFANSGVAQGIITGIRGLCNGLGPALFGFIFYLFHVDLNEHESDGLPVTVAVNGTSPMQSPAGSGILRDIHEVRVFPIIWVRCNLTVKRERQRS